MHKLTPSQQTALTAAELGTLENHGARGHMRVGDTVLHPNTRRALFDLGLLTLGTLDENYPLIPTAAGRQALRDAGVEAPAASQPEPAPHTTTSRLVPGDVVLDRGKPARVIRVHETHTPGTWSVTLDQRDNSSAIDSTMLVRSHDAEWDLLPSAHTVHRGDVVTIGRGTVEYTVRGFDVDGRVRLEHTLRRTTVDVLRLNIVRTAPVERAADTTPDEALPIVVVGEVTVEPEGAALDTSSADWEVVDAGDANCEALAELGRHDLQMLTPTHALCRGCSMDIIRESHRLNIYVSDHDHGWYSWRCSCGLQGAPDLLHREYARDAWREAHGLDPLVNRPLV